MNQAPTGTSTTANRQWALFAYGFRPFFLLAGWFAVVSVPAWWWLYRTGASPLEAVPAQLWHGHEMLFGFAGAAIGGFMLTAVPSWTGSRGFGGPPLVAVTCLWLLGRVAFALAAEIPPVVLAVAELAYLPGLLLLVAVPILRGRNRNWPLLLVLAVLWCLDAAFVRAILHGDAALARQMLLVTLDTVLLLITIIGGRIVPAFTANALRARGMEVALRQRRWLEGLTIGAMAALVLADLLQLPLDLGAAVAAAAAVLHSLRAARWHARGILGSPILWILHAAYWWLPLGLALRALNSLVGWSFAAHWLHALAIGAAASMVMAVMTRAALGHTGRPLRVSAPIVGAYLLITAAAAVRVFGPGVVATEYLSVIAASSAAWTLAFLLFALVYTPILLRPRSDGRPG